MMRAPVPTIVPGSSRDTARTLADPSEGPRWIVLWKRLATLRAQLRERQRAVSQIEASFTREIAPREHRLTDAVIHLSEILVDRHGGAGLDRAATVLLGVWIVENLEHLQDHPFVDAQRLQRLVARWQRGRASDQSTSRNDGSRGSPDEGLDRSTRRHPPGADRSHVHRTDRRPAPKDAHDRTNGNTGPSAGSAADSSAGSDRGGDIGLEAMLLGTRAGKDGFQALVERLFRRVAQALHPDREPDEEQRALKQRLMGEALAARDARDLDTLLSLHVQHLGDTLPGIEPAALESALERQLEGMRRTLARSGAGADPMQRGIIERYGGRDESVRVRRIAHHAALLDRECERIEATVQALRQPGGLAIALVERRRRELDRQAIDELTGVGDAW